MPKEHDENEFDCRLSDNIYFSRMSNFRHSGFDICERSLSNRPMQLRNHPQMARDNGCQSWPPLWTTTHHNKDDKPTGEIGSLEDVMMSELIKDKIFMFVKFEGFRYMGFMCFDDNRICSEIYILLKSKVGLSIKEIGDLDLSDTLKNFPAKH